MVMLAMGLMRNDLRRMVTADAVRGGNLGLPGWLPGLILGTCCFRGSCAADVGRIVQNWDMKSILKKSLIPLEQAFLCLDCSCISDDSRACPACCCGALLNLSNVLNRSSEISEGALYQMDALEQMEAVAA